MPFFRLLHVIASHGSCLPPTTPRNNTDTVPLPLSPCPSRLTPLPSPQHPSVVPPSTDQPACHRDRRRGGGSPDRWRDRGGRRGEERDGRGERDGRDGRRRSAEHKEDGEVQAGDGGGGDELAKLRAEKAKAGPAGGVYVPPFKLAQLMKEREDKESAEYQRLTWDQLRKGINRVVNKVNTVNLTEVRV